jgi:hypothetical protein
MRKIAAIIIAGFVLFSCGKQTSTEKPAAQTVVTGELDRTVLPIKEPTRPKYKELDARNVTPPARWDVKAQVHLMLLLF